MNIVSMAMQYLSPMIVDKIATSMGVNSAIVRMAIGAIVPSILGGVVGKVSQPGGGQVLSDILGKQDTGILGKLGDLIGGGAQTQLAEQGSNVLGSLLGGGPMSTLAGAAAKFTGLGDAPTKSLIGMLGPVVLGSLASQQKSSGLDASGLASMLMGQKDNIAAAIPSDFAKLMGGSGLLDGLGPNLAKAAAGATMTAAANKVQDAVGSAARSVHDNVPKAPSFNFLPWLLAALAAIAAYWFLFASKPKIAALPQVPAITAPGGINLGSDLGTTLGNFQRSLGTIKDAASANAALGDLRRVSDDVQRYGELANRLPAEGKKSLASYLAAALPTLLPLVANLQNNSAIGPILKPVLDSIMGGLNGMAKL